MSGDTCPKLVSSLLGRRQFQALPAGTKALLYRYARRRRFLPGEQLVRQGDVGDHVYILLSGRVRIERTHAQFACAVVLADLAAHDVAGPIGVLDGDTHYATITALTTTNALVVVSATLARALGDEPATYASVRHALDRTGYLATLRGETLQAAR